MTKNIVLVTESAAVGDYYKQLLYSLFGETITVLNFSTEQKAPDRLPLAELYLVGATSSNIFNHIISLIPPGRGMVLITLTFLKKQIERLRLLPAGARALLINLSIYMATETIAELNRLGVTHINFIPGYPGMSDVLSAEIAVTPGEKRYVPPRIKEIHDIGHRVFTVQTITEIALKLRYSWFLKSESYREYVQTLAGAEESVDMLWRENMRTEHYLDILMDALDIGIIGVDTEGGVFAANAEARNVTGTENLKLVGERLAEAAPELARAFDADSGDKNSDKLLQINDAYISATAIPVVLQGERLGRFILLRRFIEEEKRQQQFRLQMYRRGYKSKYKFEDIIGESPAIVFAKKMALKMAETDSSVLLTGESGTGKELFAHSIHNASLRGRGNMPFVAINCAALPETLLESELFGYEEGAFTGAKKGGKLGLFEYAHRGTLFLDEIEGMSANLQVKLLRVLQEREVMRVGGDRIISIDVRVIAASNEDITEMVRCGTFRRDLYYRLNTLPVNIPPLRERGDDIFLIMELTQKKLGARFGLSPSARKAFVAHDWDGNVRELINIVEYLRFSGKEYIELEDLPPVMLHSTKKAAPRASADNETCDAYRREAFGREDAFAAVLRALRDAAGGMGRLAVCESAARDGAALTEQEARGILLKLHRLGLVSVSRGRGGSRLTGLGNSLCDSLL